ncbi:hypothetical protein AVW11_12735 [Streptomyces amritsarensis]|uniref:Bacterial toxin 30 domain-containing protein n=1 Tax=Streptomyces amritsarensis TaxID=681158 RepID=A0ABX3G3X0_9ACTN|nr:hypothetical protein AVW11_12735 [Streptomyces amritsarensis]
MSIVPDDAGVRELTPHSNGGSQYGLEFTWKNNAMKTVRLRIRGPDGTAPPGSNSATGETYRVQIGRQYKMKLESCSTNRYTAREAPTSILMRQMPPTSHGLNSFRGCDGCRN